jgi:uncharacterized protein (TIGR02271 family)
MGSAELRDDDIVVPYTKDVIKNAPNVRADAELSPQEEQEIFTYYGLGSGHQGGQAGQGMAGGTTGGTGEAYGAPGAGPGTEAGTAGAGTTQAGMTDAGMTGSDRTRTDRGEAGRTEAGTREHGTAGAAGAAAAGHTGRTDTEGYDTSGPTTDNAMTRSEEQLRVGTQHVEAGRARLRKYVVTENVTQTVPVSHEEVRVEREPITDANAPSATVGPAISEEEHEVVLHAEQPVVNKEAVPVERVRLGTETVREEQTVSETARKEAIELDGADEKSVDLDADQNERSLRR